MEDLLSALALVLVFALLIGLIVFGIRREKKVREGVTKEYKILAETFSLEFIPAVKRGFLSYTYPKLLGHVNGIEVYLYSYMTGGKNKVTYTVLQMKDKKPIPNFRIIKHGFFQKIAKSFGGQDILTGNSELDQKFRLTGEDEDLLAKALDSDMQKLLIHLHDKLLAPIEMKNNVMTYTIVNHIYKEKSRDDYEKVMVLMMKLIEAMRA